MNKKYTINNQIIILAAAVLILSTIIVITSNSGIVLGKSSENTSGFLPSVFYKDNIDSAEVATPKGVLLILSSSALTTGNAGGRDGMNAICALEDPDTHFCNLVEVEKAISTTGVFFNSPFQQSWIDSYNILGTLSQNDTGRFLESSWSGGCESWNNNIDLWGYAITEKGTNIFKQICSENIHVACCKWMP